LFAIQIKIAFYFPYPVFQLNFSNEFCLPFDSAGIKWVILIFRSFAMRKLFYISWIICFLICQAEITCAQTARDTSLQQATLQYCVQYAIKHYPLLQQNLLDQEITEQEIKSRLSEWYPQINLNANYTNSFQLQSVYFAGSIVKSGSYNSSTVGFGATQNIFNRDVLLASRSARDVRLQSRQLTTSTKIDIAVNVSKAFYDVLLTQQQIQLVEEDIVRLQRNLKDAYNQYQYGIVDKTDYKTATITLNNSRADKKNFQESLKAKLVYLKQQIGYTGSDTIRVLYDSTEMEKEIFLDTLSGVNLENRIEFQLLQTEKRLEQYNLKYYKWAFIPVVSAFGGYNLNYLNDRFAGLFTPNYPNSYAGLQLAFPIFQGSKRIHDIKVAELQLRRVDWDIESLKTVINSQYASALSTYKSNFFDYRILKENVDLAREVYNTVELQYRSGVKAYLDVITAETNLRSAQSNYTNALFQVISSKLDVQKALGTIQY
jgi:outer membrane protein